MCRCVAADAYLCDLGSCAKNITDTHADAICNAECEWDENLVVPLGPCKSLGNTTRQLESYSPGLFTYSCRKMQECRCSSDASASPGCEYRSNPNYGITSFDSMPWAMISLFQAISLEGTHRHTHGHMPSHLACHLSPSLRISSTEP